MERAKVACVAREGVPMPAYVPEGIEAAGIDFVERDCETAEQAVEVAADADVVWVMGGWRLITEEVLPRLERCGAIIRSGSGTDNIPVAAATARGIIVANTPDATAIPVAEHAIALLLAVTRVVPAYDQQVRQGRWDPSDPRPRMILHGSTLGLVGYGRIARCVAERLRSFGMRVLACDPGLSDEAIAAAGAQPCALGELLPAADCVSVHTPLLDSTYHLIGAAELRQMKSTAVLINTARGPVVDSQALATALTQGWIAAAGLDVLENEPPEADNPLVGLANVVITPHTAGHHDGMFDDFWRLSTETAIDLAQKKWPVSYVNPSVEPRWEMQGR